MKRILCIVIMCLSVISVAAFAQNDDSKHKFKYRYNYEGVKEKQPGTIEQVQPGARTPLSLGTETVGRKMDGYEYCGAGCGGKQTPFKRGQNQWYVKCPENTKRCMANGAWCFCAVFKAKKGSTDRQFHAKGNRGGKVLIPANQQGTHDWFAYCVK